MPIQNSFDEQYLETLKFILNDGELKGDRTGTGTKTVFGAHINHRMSEGFPILTTKKVAFGLVASELEFFIKGLTSKAWLQERNNHIWDEWCSPAKVPYGHDAETKAKMKAEDDLGPIYGYQLRNFGGTGYDQLKKIVDTLKTNPTDRRMVASYWAPHQLKDAALPPCFIPNTQIATKNVYKNIQDIKVNDYVLDANGEYNKVTELMITPFNGNILDIKINGSPLISCTFNHPFLVKDKGWVKAEDLKEKDLVLIVNDIKNTEIPLFSHIIHKNADSEKIEMSSPSLNDMFTYGYFLGDGYLDFTNSRIFFAISDRDIDTILPKLRESIKISSFNKKSGASDVYGTTGTKHFNILKDFVDLDNDKNKIIPNWVFNLPDEYIKQFLLGYFAADGCKSKTCKKDIYLATTVSRDIAFGIQRLFNKLNGKCNISFSKKEPKTVILGRVVNQKDVYQLRAAFTPRIKTIKHTNGNWTRINKLTKREYIGNVYNFSVENSHTYTVNNIATHNCHYTWGVNVVNNKLNLMFIMRSVDWPLGAPFDLAHYGLLLHLLAKEAGLEEGQLVGNFMDTHVYMNQIEKVSEQLTRTGYELPKIVTENWTSIYDWKYTDSKLINYQSDAAIKMTVAI